ncbi:hypothetical protein BC829DRAFT_380703 [Chytridium lagenaria]|nr:hypothetical protein BC829DRAFT_380703 [Chytridium lagenaria]
MAARLRKLIRKLRMKAKKGKKGKKVKKGKKPSKKQRRAIAKRLADSSVKKISLKSIMYRRIARKIRGMARRIRLARKAKKAGKKLKKGAKKAGKKIKKSAKKASKKAKKGLKKAKKGLKKAEGQEGSSGPSREASVQGLTERQYKRLARRIRRKLEKIRTANRRKIRIIRRKLRDKAIIRTFLKELMTGKFKGVKINLLMRTRRIARRIVRKIKRTLNRAARRQKRLNRRNTSTCKNGKSLTTWGRKYNACDVSLGMLQSFSYDLKDTKLALDSFYMSATSLGFSCPADRKPELAKSICKKVASISPDKNPNASLGESPLSPHLCCKRSKVGKDEAAFTPGSSTPPKDKPAAEESAAAPKERRSKPKKKDDKKKPKKKNKSKKADDDDEEDKPKKKSKKGGKKDKKAGKKPEKKVRKKTAKGKNRKTPAARPQAFWPKNSVTVVKGSAGKNATANATRPKNRFNLVRATKNFDSKNVISNCKRGTKVKTWGVEYDACDFVVEAVKKCKSKDGRFAYDSMWDSRKAIGCDCGPSQYFYKALSWENYCPRLHTVMAGMNDTNPATAGKTYNPLEYCVALGCEDPTKKVVASTNASKKNKASGKK